MLAVCMRHCSADSTGGRTLGILKNPKISTLSILHLHLFPCHVQWTLHSKLDALSNSHLPWHDNGAPCSYHISTNRLNGMRQSSDQIDHPKQGEEALKSRIVECIKPCPPLSTLVIPSCMVLFLDWTWRPFTTKEVLSNDLLRKVQGTGIGIFSVVEKM